MIKFLHGGDFHLDSPFSGLSPENASLRRQEQRNMLEELTELANGESCDLILLSGDLFDSSKAYQDTLEALVRALGACHGQVFISPGNHDFYASGSPYHAISWPDNVHIFTKNHIENIYIPSLDVTVYGGAFTAMSSENMLEDFSVEDKESTNIMVLHGEVDVPSSDYCPISSQNIGSSGLDYLALGHIHGASGLLGAGATSYGWAGCAMGRGFDELGEKGVYIGSISEHKVALRFCPLSGRRYEIRTVALKMGDDPMQRVMDGLEVETQGDMYRIIFTGEAEQLDVRGLHEKLKDRFFSLNLRDKTRPPLDLWKDSGVDSLKGLFLQELQEAMCLPNQDQDVCTLAATIGLACMEDREVMEP